MSKKLKILFLGDLVGKPGRLGVRNFLNEHRGNYDFIIANIENASHGYGLTKKNYEELSSYGIQAMTSGNHIWDRKEIFDYINDAHKLIRPLNYPKGTPGVGSRIFEIDGGNISIGIINILGTIFMSPLIPPWELLEEEIKKIQSKTSVILIDCHAEATAEKIVGSHLAAKNNVSAVIGTHTHVQTADEYIMKNGTAYISDIGFCGSYNSVIGMEIGNSVDRLVKMLPIRLEVGAMDLVQINGAELLIDSETGQSESIKRINQIINFNDEVN